MPEQPDQPPRTPRAFRFPWRSKAQARQDIDAELEFHLEMRARELAEQGFTPTEARQIAERQFGDVEFTRSYMRRMSMELDRNRARAEWARELAQDARYAVRTMLASPVFTLVAVVTLALGIGANTAIFSVVNGILFRPLPYPHPDQLVRVWSSKGSAGEVQEAISDPDLADWRAQRNAFAEIGGWWYQDAGSGMDLTGRGEPKRIAGAFITPGFFPTLGVAPIAGRLPREDELTRGGNDLNVVLSYDFWQREFGGDESIVGKTLRLDGELFTVLGVMPKSFRFPNDRVDVYAPWSHIPDEGIPHTRDDRVLEAIARLKPGVALERGRAELAAVARRLAELYPEDRGVPGVTMMSLQDQMVGNVRTGLLVLLGAVSFVLLMTCVNVASLLLARANVRQRELAVRVALGAGRGRIVRQLLTESMILALVGGAVGVALAIGGQRLLLSLGSDQLPRTAEVGIDATVLLFSLGVSLATGMLFGLIPALRAASPELQQTLREGGRGTSGGNQRARNALVTMEVALAVVLVVGAGLMTKSFINMLRVRLGFVPEHALVVNFSIPDRIDKRPGGSALYRTQVLDQVRSLPGVVAAGGAKNVPFRGVGERARFVPEGMSVSSLDQAPSGYRVHVSDGYFRALGVPIVAGREFERTDDTTHTFVLLVNETLAKKYFPARSAVGAHLMFGGTPVPIIGVVGDVKQESVDEQTAPTYYLHYLQNPRSRMMLVVRTRGEPLAMARAVQNAIWSIDRDQTITDVFTMEQAIGTSVARPRFLTVLLGLFGGLGLVLGALGLYGVLAYLVSQRQREIGVRIALGARPADVTRMVVLRGLTLAVVGVAIGMVGAVLLTRFMQGVLFGVGALDPTTFVLVGIALLGIAVLASWIPARRATRVDPAIALRAD